MALLYRAPWVMANGNRVIADGAVLVEDELISAVGSFSELRKASSAAIIDCPETILMPALVNGHAHLELSALAGLVPPPALAGDMVAWVADLVSKRAKGHYDWPGQARLALEAMAAEGVGLVADIGNAPAGWTPNDASLPQVDFFLELLGLSCQGRDYALEQMGAFAGNVCGHAPYSVHPETLRASKDRARQRRAVYPIHLAESAAELEFLATGTGPFRDFLEERGVWDGSFTPPQTGPLNYLESLSLLDDKTLCVHCLHLSAAELDLMAAKKVKVCLCPGSNDYIGVGTARVADFLQRGILPCLGTDSLASNPKLSIWAEMNIIGQNNPDLRAQTIIAMATEAGAQALGHSEFGTLAPGKSAAFLAVNYQGQEPLEFLAHDVAPKQVKWRHELAGGENGR